MNVYGDYDVVICGAGPAGIGAAVAAGRAGARVLVLEQQYHVGGIGTSTAIHSWCDSQGGPIFDELEQRIDALGLARRQFNPNVHIHERGRVRLDGEAVKAVALGMVREAGVDVLFGTTVADACVEDDRVAGVLVANKGGLSKVTARVTIDCTADADVAAAAGAEFLKGDPDDGRLMHVNFAFGIGGVDPERAKSEALSEQALLDAISQAHTRGELHAPSGIYRPQAHSFPYHGPESALALNYWEIDGVDCSDPKAVSDTLVECQLSALEVVQFCRKHLPGYADCRITRFWDVLGTRESRRIVGRYTLTRDDVLAGRKFDDGVAQACFFIDFHDSPPGRSTPYTIEFKRENTPPQGDWYEIPYRCLVPKAVTGLLVAGRSISADRDGLASLRIMPTCMFLGQAAGTAAAMAVEQGISTHECKGRHVRQRMAPSGISHFNIED